MSVVESLQVGACANNFVLYDADSDPQKKPAALEIQKKGALLVWKKNEQEEDKVVHGSVLRIEGMIPNKMKQWVTVTIKGKTAANKKRDNTYKAHAQTKPASQDGRFVVGFKFSGGIVVSEMQIALGKGAVVTLVCLAKEEEKQEAETKGASMGMGGGGLELEAARKAREEEEERKRELCDNLVRFVTRVIESNENPKQKLREKLIELFETRKKTPPQNLSTMTITGLVDAYEEFCDMQDVKKKRVQQSWSTTTPNKSSRWDKLRRTALRIAPAAALTTGMGLAYFGLGGSGGSDPVGQQIAAPPTQLPGFGGFTGPEISNSSSSEVWGRGSWGASNYDAAAAAAEEAETAQAARELHKARHWQQSTAPSSAEAAKEELRVVSSLNKIPTDIRKRRGWLNKRRGDIAHNIRIWNGISGSDTEVRDLLRLYAETSQLQGVDTRDLSEILFGNY